MIEHPAVTGYIAAQIRMPKASVKRVLNALEAMDSEFVRWKLLRSTGLTLLARKRADMPPTK